jgi:hypothetical protein
MNKERLFKYLQNCAENSIPQLLTIIIFNNFVRKAQAKILLHTFGGDFHCGAPVQNNKRLNWTIKALQENGRNFLFRQSRKSSNLILLPL